MSKSSKNAKKNASPKLQLPLNPIINALQVTAIEPSAFHCLRDTLESELDSLLRKAVAIAEYCGRGSNPEITTMMVTAVLPYVAFSDRLSKDVFSYAPREDLAVKENLTRKLRHFEKEQGKFIAEPSLFCNYVIQQIKTLRPDFKISKNAVMMLQTHIETLACEILGQCQDMAQKGAINLKIMNMVLSIRRQNITTSVPSIPEGDFTPYIYKVLKQVHPSQELSPEAMVQMNALCNRLALVLVDEVDVLKTHFSDETLVEADSRMVQTAIRIIFGGELSKHAVSEMNKAITKFSHSEARLSRRRSDRAGLQFHFHIVEGILRMRRMKFQEGVLVSLSAVLEYLAAEVLELAGNAARDRRTSIIEPLHIRLAIINDEELSSLASKLGFRILQGGGSCPDTRWVPPFLDKKETPITEFLGEDEKVACDKQFLLKEDDLSRCSALEDEERVVYDESIYDTEAVMYEDDLQEFTSEYADNLESAQKEQSLKLEEAELSDPEEYQDSVDSDDEAGGEDSDGEAEPRGKDFGGDLDAEMNFLTKQIMNMTKRIREILQNEVPRKTTGKREDDSDDDDESSMPVFKKLGASSPGRATSSPSRAGVKAGVESREDGKIVKVIGLKNKIKVGK